MAFFLVAFLPLAAALGVARLHRDAGSAARTAALPTDHEAQASRPGPTGPQRAT